MWAGDLSQEPVSSEGAEGRGLGVAGRPTPQGHEGATGASTGPKGATGASTGPKRVTEAWPGEKRPPRGPGTLRKEWVGSRGSAQQWVGYACNRTGTPSLCSSPPPIRTQTVAIGEMYAKKEKHGGSVVSTHLSSIVLYTSCRTREVWGWGGGAVFKKRSFYLLSHWCNQQIQSSFTLLN